MRQFPIFLELRGQAVLVMGGGEGAERKTVALEASGAIVRRAAAFAPALLDGCALAFGAEATEADLRALHAACIARGLPVNVIDRPELCSFFSPSVIDRDPLTVAVGTGGAAPALARLVRGKIEAQLPPGLGALAALAERFQARLRAKFPSPSARRQILEEAFTGRIAELVFAGQEDAADAAFTDLLGSAQAAKPGMVYLVGGGPGAADLLTLRAQRILLEADVIVHDRLVGDSVLAMARRDATRIYVGKSRANHCLQQSEINALLIKLAGEGRRVVRLKGGDPLVFGRGGEEAEALRAAGIALEIVPGVTAALACAAQAGVPLTHREAARVLSLVTGHTHDGRLDLNFSALTALGGTIGVYMGINAIVALRDGLLGAGMASDTPAAVIENGGTPRQRNAFATLATLADITTNWPGIGPALILIGQAVGRAPREPGIQGTLLEAGTQIAWDTRESQLSANQK